MISRYAHQGYGEMFEYNHADELPTGDKLYVLASDYEALEADFKEAKEHLLAIAIGCFHSAPGKEVGGK